MLGSRHFSDLAFLTVMQVLSRIEVMEFGQTAKNLVENLVENLLKTCSKPAQNLLETWSKTWFYAGFEQDRSNGIWTLAFRIENCCFEEVGLLIPPLDYINQCHPAPPTTVNQLELWRYINSTRPACLLITVQLY